MAKNRLTYMKNILMPCLLFSSVTGVLTGVLIFLFKLAVSHVVATSERVYAFVRLHPEYLPLLLGGAAALGGIAALLLRRSENCRGGGIPTAVALLRGLIDFHWIKSIFLLFFSAMLTYFGGIPLGNEGPSVQMGTAVGRGTVRLLGRNNRAWDRYIMTGGACAGFAAATGAPLTGIFFAFEEAHRRFSPMIFMVASMTVWASTMTMELLCSWAGISSSMFGITALPTLPLRFSWVALVIGVICGLCAVLFTQFYRGCRSWIQKHLSKMPFALKIATVFVAVSLIGFVANDCLSSGHALIHQLMEEKGIWYLLILCFGVRAILLVIANNVGVTGGLFVPMLAFGAILGALCGQGMMAMGCLDREYYAVVVILGMISFLGASSRTPITAIAFAVEALCGMSNILPVILSVTFSFLVIETCGVTAFNETVVEGRVEAVHAGKTAQVVDAHLIVRDGSFVVGKEIRDILWPPTCAVLSIDLSPTHIHGATGIAAGDVLHLHYQTYEPADTMEMLESLVGKQSDHIRTNMHPGSDTHQVPEI